MPLFGLIVNCLIYTPIPYQVQIHPSLAGGSDSYLIVPARFISLLRDLNPSDSLPVETQAQFLFKGYVDDIGQDSNLHGSLLDRLTGIIAF